MLKITHLLGFSGTLQECLSKAKQPAFFARLRELNLVQTRKDVAHAVPSDIGLVQAVQVLDGFDKFHAELLTQIREFYAWYAPEFVRTASAQELTNSITTAKNFLAAQKAVHNSMGGNLCAEDIAIMQRMNTVSEETGKQREFFIQDIEFLMKKLAPNLLHVAGFLIGAKLVCLAGGIQQLAMASSSFVQLLGAKKALFRHVITGAKSPKHGIILQHPVVQSANNKGRAARILAGKIVIAARVDCFKGSFVGDELLKSAVVQICK